MIFLDLSRGKVLHKICFPEKNHVWPFLGYQFEASISSPKAALHAVHKTLDSPLCCFRTAYHTNLFFFFSVEKVTRHQRRPSSAKKPFFPMFESLPIQQYWELEGWKFGILLSSDKPTGLQVSSKSANVEPKPEQSDAEQPKKRVPRWNKIFSCIGYTWTWAAPKSKIGCDLWPNWKTAKIFRDLQSTSFKHIFLKEFPAKSLRIVTWVAT